MTRSCERARELVPNEIGSTSRQAAQTKARTNCSSAKQDQPEAGQPEFGVARRVGPAEQALLPPRCFGPVPATVEDPQSRTLVLVLRGSSYAPIQDSTVDELRVYT